MVGITKTRRVTLERRKVRARRGFAGLSGRQVSEALDVPIASYYRWETGESRIAWDRLRDLARILRCRMGDLTA